MAGNKCLCRHLPLLYNISGSYHSCWVVRKGERCDGNESGVEKGGKLMAGRPREGSSAKFEEDGMYEGDIQMECVVSR